MVDAAGKEGHRERLKARFLATRGVGVADYELLELALTYAIPRKDVKPIAKALLAKFSDVAGVLKASAEQLEAVEGMGPHSAVLFGLVGQLALRAGRENMRKRPVLGNRLELMDYLYTLFSAKEREEFHVLFLDARLGLIVDETMFSGTLSESCVGAREVLKRALEVNAAGLIVAHNHPSGNPRPSVSDEVLTADLSRACNAMGIVLHDHVVVGREAHFSFKGAGKL